MALFDNGHDQVPPATINDWATFMEMLRARGIPLGIHADLGNDEAPTRYPPLMKGVLRLYPDNAIVWVYMGLSHKFTTIAAVWLPWCTTPIEAESSLGPDSHHPIISLSGIPSAVMVLRILHPILASTLCAANPLARIAEPTIAL